MCRYTSYSPVSGSTMLSAPPRCPYSGMEAAASRSPASVISNSRSCRCGEMSSATMSGFERSEEHTSELQSRGQLVCRLLLEKKKLSKYQYPRGPRRFLRAVDVAFQTTRRMRGPGLLSESVKSRETLDPPLRTSDARVIPRNK